MDLGSLDKTVQQTGWQSWVQTFLLNNKQSQHLESTSSYFSGPNQPIGQIMKDLIND